ncbi:hypothetical protein DRP44_06485 [candidate division TA06 bacterium]|uniref:FlgD/Vpr Ig-like domain-containing protein n=1 Tax=candidate division TA06 bacterium TaxID=2250710 RepID=A0A660S6D9_UNCT6|nr:MAG: hypothetical protein DRP44_06485 [candidate division TA06 bacterium]
MKNVFITLLIVVLIPLFAFSNDMDPNAFPVSNTSITTQSNYDIGAYDPVKNTRWGTDVQIYSGNVNYISYDYDRNTHNLFSLVITNHGGSDDSINIYKSADLGSTWYLWNTYTMPSVPAYTAKLLVTDNADTAWVSYVLNFQDYYGGELYWMRILESDSTYASIMHISDLDGDTIYSFDAAYRDSMIYIAFCGIDTSVSSSPYIIAESYNINNGSGWTNKTGLYVNPVTTAPPAVSAGKDGNVFVAILENRLHQDTMNIRLKKSSNFGASWSGTVPVSNNTGNFPLSNISCAASNDSIVWVGLTFDVNGDKNWGYYYSTDAGVTFNYSAIYYTAGHSSWDQDLGSMSMAKANSFLTVAFKEDTSGMHNVVFGYIMPSDPSHFYNDTLEVINDNWATGTFAPVAGTKITKVGSFYYTNSSVLYAGWGPQNVYFDAYNFTGVKEKIENKKNVEFSVSATSISRNNVDIKLTLGKTANVKATIYNLNGQKIKTLVSGTRESGVYNLKWNRRDSNNNRVASGIYLIRVSADNSTKTGKIVIIK